MREIREHVGKNGACGQGPHPPSGPSPEEKGNKNLNLGIYALLLWRSCHEVTDEVPSHKFNI
jgi:hypothetical protein